MDLQYSLISKCKLVSQIYNQVPLSDQDDVKFLKNDAGASILRNTGNLHYQNGEFEFALMHYSKGLALAPVDSTEYSKIFGNRSAALYRLGMYEECLIEINRALEAGYEENLKPKLMKRMSSCQEILNRQPSTYDSLEADRNKLFVTSPTHYENILCANVPLYICSTESNKREIRAKEDIAPGQLISIEKPYTFDISQKFCSLRCHNCFAQSYLLIPCDHCTNAMFCDEKCRDESWKSEHKWMCPFTDGVKISVTSTELVALKTVIKARCDKESWSDFYNSILEADKTFEITVLRGFVENEYGKMVFDSNEYCSVYGLNVERTSISSQKMLYIASTSAVFIRFLEKYTTFFKDAPEEPVNDATVTVNKYIFLTGGLLLHNIMICLSNPMQIAGMTPQLDKQYVDIRFGTGIYPFSSLTTHSCTPNTSVVFKDNKAALFAVAPIKRDQKVTISYGSHYTVQSYQTRKNYLQSNLQLICDCDACVNRWPIQTELPPGSFNNLTCSFRSILSYIGLGGKGVKFENIASVDVYNQLRHGDRKLAIEVLPKLCEGMTYLEDYKPCIEYAVYQNLLRLTFALLGNIVPRNLSLDLPERKERIQ